jgi:conjugative relaxase-like TrwC/TraI family protein
VPGTGWVYEAGDIRVLSSAKIGVSSWRYYQNTVRDGACEYYLAEGEQPGVWVGRGLPQLGLQPGTQVSEAQLEAVFARALHPVTGQPLGRAWRVDAVTGFDLTFSAPKSVSTLWALGGVTAAQQVDAAHRAAVTAALAYLDEHAGLSRRGTDGVQQIATKGLVAALFDHRTSRAGDPQLHTHALVPNKLLSADGVWRTIDGHEMFHHKKAAGGIYQAALRAELHSRLGVVFDTPNAHGQAEILGVPADLMGAWSKRAAHIKAEAEPTISEYEATLGRDLTAGEKAAVTKTAVLKTRGAKHPTPSMADLHIRWRLEARALGWDAVTLHDHVVAAQPPFTGRGDNGPRPDLTGELVADAVLAAGRRRAVFSRADLTVEVAARLPLSAAARADQVRVAVEQQARRGIGTDRGSAVAVEQQARRGVGTDRGSAVTLGPVTSGVTPRASDPRFSSTEVINAEKQILGHAQLGGCSQWINTADLTTKHPALATLAPDQLDAVRGLTTGYGTVVVLTAPAGAGKTTTIGAATRIWEGHGYQVIGLAPSARAAAELGKATGGPADTLAKWLHQHRNPDPSADHQHPSQLSPPGLTQRSVLIIDEASMASTLDLAVVTAAVHKAGGKLVLVGDPAQIGVINGPGGILPALTAAGHGIELTGIHRFTNDWEADASLRLRAGDKTVIDTYEKQGRLHAVTDPDQATAAVFTHWQAARAKGRDVMMLARTRDDVDQLNTLAKAAAQTSGDSHGPELHVGNKNFQAGDVIRTRRNQRSIGVGDSHVRNGDRYTILATTEGGALLVDDLTGRGATLLPPTYVTQHVEHGWASTIDTAQGATTDVAVLLVRPGIDREHLYVGLTRGRHENHAYIAPAPNDENGHPPTASNTTQQILVAALLHSSQQDAAHTVLERTRAETRSGPAIATPRRLWESPDPHAGPTYSPSRPTAPAHRSGPSR